ncbi:5-carboxymethyl-2-hydroxymuconateDelta-isomerase [Fibrella aestuarina BUZ 2]|uniref:5-carboxymethyl-2-hydroxymuconateDelta-isomerase n=1 Tax=Fibrella aestuarina BUZ 2 TaxID=1166018 RepID=I0KE32_9BACT|nr:fumarylacetoacetate hydrolase family protein [Fibrella aestuarina]CCH02385.1 5-carboxymethyl-2-hydroxymuconateDelta-isomerase [Fibrella aestuarina BUZ 2]
MKLFRFGPDGHEHPAVELPDGRRLNVTHFGGDYDETFFATDGPARLAHWLESHADQCPNVPDEVRYGPCVKRPSKIVCVGLNYAKHAAETGATPPTEPILFFKSTTSLCGPNDDVVIPKHSVKTDWEVELAVVIGKRASYVELDDALDYVAGYAVINDYSERAFQLERGGQWDKGKGCDTFAPLGPYLVTKDDVPNPNSLNLWLSLNNERLQDSNTDDMIFDVPTLVSYISQFMTLLPGDVISTGTPSGVGLGLKPPRYLVPGDVVTLGIEGLGHQQQTAVAYN